MEADFPQRYRFVRSDICDAELVALLLDQALHFAAESHKDRSIQDAQAFVLTNVLGTQCLLHAALSAWGDDQTRRFLYVSTDEVYGVLRLEDGRRFRARTGPWTTEAPTAPARPVATSWPEPIITPSACRCW